ncbi:MAG TPA: type II secretion system F family protein [Iamia sp.]|nr:type II secretion system F family protein [Iamia sp.]
MDLTLPLAVAVAAIGLAVVAVGLAGRARRPPVELADLLGLPADDRRPAPDALAPDDAPAAGALGLADRALERWDRPGSLGRRIERADLALRPAELVVATVAAGLALGGLGELLLGTLWAIPVGLALAPLGARLLLDVRAGRRARRFATQLPDALGLVAGSLAAGHTFLRSIQLMADELDDPLAAEFRRVVAETQLGLPLVASLERMSDRLRLRDVAWMVQAIRIQQTVGGQLSELLATLSEFMRAREEVRREVNVLTAEGRASAWVLGAMPVCLFVAVQVINPGYLDPLLRGWGLVWLGLTVVSMATGIAIILRLVDSVDV